jgi:hypothetical protein
MSTRSPLFLIRYANASVPCLSTRKSPPSLKHVRREAQKPLSLCEELEVPPVERRGQHRASQPRASHTPSGVSLPGSIK